MPQWFIRGLRRGVVTTRYPAHPDPSAADLPTPPAFRAGAISEPMADRLAGICPSNALGRDDGALTFDVGACTACGRCRREAPQALTQSGQFELATTDRSALRKRFALRDGAPAGNDGAQTSQAADRVRTAISSQFGRSLHIRTLDTGSCAACEQEIRLLAAPHYDLHRLGFFFTPAPRHADLLLVTGPMLRVFAAAARKTYEAMPGPKLVVATGACALGGVYQPDEFSHGSVDALLPVDVWIPGCPPSPLALLEGLLVAVGRLAEKVSGMSFAGAEES